jgi:hypothetical protein
MTGRQVVQKLWFPTASGDGDDDDDDDYGDDICLSSVGILLPLSPFWCLEI